MNDLNFFYQQISPEKSLNQPSISESKLIRGSLDTIKPPLEIQPYIALSLSVICFVTVWAIIIYVIPGIAKILRNVKITSKHLKEVPCRNCQFFAENPYLQCAIHPATALTEQALNCPDYQLKKWVVVILKSK